MFHRCQPRAAFKAAKPSPTIRHLAGRALAGWLLALTASHAILSAHAAPTQYEQGNPSDGEQYMLLQINYARMNPTAEGQRLAQFLNANPAIVAQYSINVSQVESDFAALPAVPPLAFNADLIAAARSHSTDLATHGGYGPGGNDHEGYDGSSPDSRVYASGFRTPDGQDGFNAENVAPGGFASFDENLAGYLVDWGNPDLGHRKTIMSGTSGGAVMGSGVATITGKTTLVETEDFGSVGFIPTSAGLAYPDVPAMVTGVVYTDKNGNGQYDPGEGVAGVTVSMDAGAYYAVTTSSGGFSLPLVNADGSNADGVVVVRASALSGESAGRTAVVTISKYATQYGSYRANVEWEVVPGKPAAGVSAGPALAPFFDGAAALGGDWYYLAFTGSDFFGYFNVLHYPYVYHDDLGWEFAQDANDGKSGVYLYDYASQSWFYTSPTFGFPYLYDFTRRAVLYYYPASGDAGHYGSAPRYFYDFSSKQIITL